MMTPSSEQIVETVSKYCNTNMNTNTIQNMSLTASYHIFLCKDNPTFLEPPYLLPPLVTKEATASS